MGEWLAELTFLKNKEYRWEIYSICIWSKYCLKPEHKVMILGYRRFCEQSKYILNTLLSVTLWNARLQTNLDAKGTRQVVYWPGAGVCRSRPLRRRSLNKKHYWNSDSGGGRSLKGNITGTENNILGKVGAKANIIGAVNITPYEGAA